MCYILPVEISWLGHSCFRIKGNQVNIITDPYPPDLGYSLGKHTAGIVTVSHPHPSHSYTEGIGGDWKLVSGPGEYEIGGVLIIGVATFHDDQKGAIRGKNTAYLLEVDGVSLCHLGDLGHALTTEQAEEIGGVDVLLLPVGGVSTIDAEDAAAVMRRLEPQVVIPMHYGTPALSRQLDPVEKFLKELGKENVESRPKLTVSKTSLTAGPQVVILDYKS